MKKVFIKTFGCRTNIVDSQIITSNLKNNTIVYDEKEADIIIINSCTVTNSADNRVKSYINSIKKLANKELIYTGCGVLTKADKLYSSGMVDKVFASSSKEDISSILNSQKRVFQKGNLTHLDKTIIQDISNKTKAFVKIQEGCDFRCSYCVIPYVRGDSRSYQSSQILKQIDILANSGFKEFVLTGTNIGSYGKNQQNNTDGFARLLKDISKIKGVVRIRFGSIEPVQITDEFKELLDEPWMAKHLHIALQHTTKEMLNIMNRRNQLKSDLKLFEFLNQKGYAIGTDFIVGHPGESEAIWQEAVANFKKFPLTHLHCFRYSKRDGTKSATMTNQISGDIAKERLKELEYITKEKNYAFRQKQKSLKVLIEQKKDGFFVGYDQYFNHMKIASNKDIKNRFVTIDEYQVTKDINIAKI
ncbi:MAG: tRNA (N(6)-L-threonylcarbamoyladenosine(37)-C(2))-methylthiotransferase MtaB [Campylobacteraceae bacterium 4484_166]|nr:MAG: tRNA (N(6)-L-threonylcarbamoyladenosine(37)-C(2))-methylthiotransferase MtaB [Campylobacteraceae bacterium 4484_166]